MSCHELQNLISAYVDDELTEEENLLISDHLDSCSECNMLYLEMGAISGMFRDVAEVEPPAGLKNKIMSQVTIREKKEASGMIYHMTWNLRRVAAGLILFFLSMGIGIYPLLSHNMALNDQDSYLSKEADYEEIESFGVRTVAPDKSYEGMAVLESESDYEDEKSDEESEDSDDGVPMLGIMEINPSEDEADGENEDPADDQLMITGEFTDDSLSEDENIIDIVGTPNLVFSFTGVVFGVLMIWYAKPSKK
jgi:hypothetical protein